MQSKIDAAVRCELRTLRRALSSSPTAIDVISGRSGSELKALVMSSRAALAIARCAE
jgi:hypothetical protein